jgi:hypothetical protein
LLPGAAGEDSGWSDALPPAAREPEQAPAQHCGGEVLLRDRHFLSFPALAELVQVGDDDVAQERVDREPREQVVEHGVGVGVVEAR